MSYQSILEKEKVFMVFSKFLTYYSKKIYLEGYQNEDIVQEGYVALCNAYEKYDERINSNFYFYGKRAIINRYFELIRKKSKYPYEISICSDNEIYLKALYRKSLDYSLEDEVIARIDSDILKNAINNMPKEYKALINSIYWRNTKISRYASANHIPYKVCINLHNKIKRLCLEELIDSELNKFYL